ncbi:hypothetical protein ACFU8Q_28910 [Streptomyces sp. NPDC057543]|uniref:hypothetical protein n=1 Tax=Streptomyces sp. NPDC057543 TaxID=3346163 RepID=UPI00368263F5
MFDTTEVGVFLGLDVGKSAHHGHGLTPAGKKVFDLRPDARRPAPEAVGAGRGIGGCVSRRSR